MQAQDRIRTPETCDELRHLDKEDRVKQACAQNGGSSTPETTYFSPRSRRRALKRGFLISQFVLKVTIIWLLDEPNHRHFTRGSNHTETKQGGRIDTDSRVFSLRVHGGCAGNMVNTPISSTAFDKALAYPGISRAHLATRNDC